MIVTCRRGDVQLFAVEDFADTVAGSDDGRFIVGLSNRGSENAFWVRSSDGRLIKRKTHNLGRDHWVGVHYCLESVTNVRQWFDEKQPDVRFQIEAGKLVHVTVRSCDGKDLNLF